MHTDSYTKKKTVKVAFHGLETPLESKELVVLYQLQLLSLSELLFGMLLEYVRIILFTL